MRLMCLALLAVTACTGVTAGSGHSGSVERLRFPWYAVNQDGHGRVVAVHPDDGSFDLIADLDDYTIDPPVQMIVSADQTRAMIVTGNGSDPSGWTSAFLVVGDGGVRALPRGCIPKAWSRGLGFVFCVFADGRFIVANADGRSIFEGNEQDANVWFARDDSRAVVGRSSGATGSSPVALTILDGDGPISDLLLNLRSYYVLPFKTSLIVVGGDPLQRWLDENGRTVKVPNFPLDRAPPVPEGWILAQGSVWRVSDRKVVRVCRLPNPLGQLVHSESAAGSLLFLRPTSYLHVSCDGQDTTDLTVPLLAGADHAYSGVVSAPDHQRGAVITSHWLSKVGSDGDLVGYTLDLWDFDTSALPERLREISDPTWPIVERPRFSNEGSFLLWLEGTTRDERLLSANLRTGAVRELTRSVQFAATTEM